MKSRVASFALTVFMAAAVPAAAQGHRTPPPDPAKVPAELKLAGDPALSAEWSASRPVPPPSRGPDGAVGSLSYVCRACREAGHQRADAGTPVLPSEFLGRGAAGAAAWAERLGDAPSFLFATKKAALLVVAADLAAPPMSAAEEARLRTWFPKLPKKLAKLDGHQLGHLYADRLAAVEADLAAALELDPAGDMVAAGPYGPPPAARTDVLLFGAVRGARAAADFFFDVDAWFPGGGLFGGRPVVVAHAADGAAAHRRFAFSCALGLSRAVLGAEGALPPWMRVGLAHALEARACDVADESAVGTTPPDVVADAKAADAADRDAYLRTLIDAGHSGQWNALCLASENGLSTRSRMQAGSFTRYLLGVDRARYALLVRTLASRGAGAAKDGAFDAAAKSAYRESAAVLDEGWRLWASGPGPGAAAK
jgi:hypothetical protein